MQQRACTMSIGERETILRRYLPLVRRVARRFLGRAGPHADLDDLVAWGALGLLDALDRYDPAREALFATYARFRIRGAILDQLRELDWVPRSVREKAASVERVARLIETRRGRPASEDEMARGLGLSLSAYRDLLGQIAPVTFVSLDTLGFGSGDEDLPLLRTEPDPLRGLLRRERLLLVAEAIDRLPERDQLLLSLYYRDDLTMKEVGAVLGLTESRVSQLHTSAVLRLRATLDGVGRPVAQAG
jgi:RNA polymerase sigma factor for flagellar operon FliA